MPPLSIETRGYHETKLLSTSGTNDLNVDLHPIAFGEAVVVTAIAAEDHVTASKLVKLSVVQNNVEYELVTQNTGANKVSCEWQGEVLLHGNDFIRAKIISPTANDEAHVSAHGFYLDEATA